MSRILRITKQLIPFRSFTLLLGGILLIWPLVTACQNEKDSITIFRDILTQAYAQGKFNGNALIASKGKILYQGAFGRSGFGVKDSLHLNSVFRLGSVSKQFTAMAIMILKERGQLSYHQDLNEFIPELPYQGINVRHLLNHTSGLPDYVTLMDNQWKPQLPKDDSRRFIEGNEDIISMLAEAKPKMLFQPGEKFEYSNTGYVMLASIITRVSGLPFEEFLQQNIFEPTGMIETSVYKYVPEYDANLPNRVFGIIPDSDSNHWNANDSHYLNGAQGDGGIYATVGDLWKWDGALYTERLVARSTLNEAFKGARLINGDSTRYGFGWFLERPSNNHSVVSHGGGWVGFRTYIYRDLDEKTFFVLLTNNSSEYLDGVTKAIKDQL